MKFLRSAISFVRVPLTRWYLKSERRYTYRGVAISVAPGVFHPGLFPSTRMLLEYLQAVRLGGTRLLELGCGTGLVALVAEKAGAQVTASDISKLALQNTKQNAEINRSQLSVIESDLFDQIPEQPFDWIVINPPYYARRPETESDKAWYCGADFEYFRKLFVQLAERGDSKTTILMTLAGNADVATIQHIAKGHGIRFNTLAVRSSWLDGTDYLFSLTLH